MIFHEQINYTCYYLPYFCHNISFYCASSFYPENASPITLPLGLNLLGFIIILIIINCLIYLMEKQTTNGSNFVICSSNLPS